jgi:hypothetical protein
MRALPLLEKPFHDHAGRAGSGKGRVSRLDKKKRLPEGRRRSFDP